jgi:hypothetical protein
LRVIPAQAIAFAAIIEMTTLPLPLLTQKLCVNHFLRIQQIGRFDQQPRGVTGHQIDIEIAAGLAGCEGSSARAHLINKP